MKETLISLGVGALSLLVMVGLMLWGLWLVLKDEDGGDL